MQIARLIKKVSDAENGHSSSNSVPETRNTSQKQAKLRRYEGIIRTPGERIDGMRDWIRAGYWFETSVGTLFVNDNAGWGFAERRVVNVDNAFVFLPFILSLF